jgi:hypothetical protein
MHSAAADADRRRSLTRVRHTKKKRRCNRYEARCHFWLSLPEALGTNNLDPLSIEQLSWTMN